MADPRPALRREMGLWDLVLFNIAAVAGIRWLAAAAHVGPASISLWVLAAVFFFVPSALAVSALSARYPEQGGIYAWTRNSFGDWHGFLCGWCYWLSNLFYFPALLLAGVGMAVYAFGPGWAPLAENRLFVVSASLVVLWVALLTNLVGVRVGKWTEDAGGAGTFTAGLLLVVLGLAVFLSRGPATPLDILPRWDWEKINFWSQIAFAFGGLELGAIMGGEIRDPRRSVPRAAWISGSAIAAFYILGTLAILAILPPAGVSIMTGLTQAAAEASSLLGIPFVGPLAAVLITLGVTGQLGAWLSGSARVPFVMGLDRYLPPAFARLHPRWRTPHVAILVQGAACSVFLVAMQAGEDLRTGYQLLVDITVVTYFIPFVYMFLAAFRHGVRAGALSGLLVTVAGIGFSLAPPAGVESPWLFEAKLIGGSAALILAGRIAFTRGKRSFLRADLGM